MSERHDIAADRRDPVRDSAARERWIAAIAVAAVVLWRSGVFLWWEQSSFDADQAITGLMAKHISEGRAFPVFWYGQNYMLAVEAWLAAPVFLLFGPSVLALKLPLLIINLAIALLLLRTLEREVGLRPRLAMVPTLFFALPAPHTAALILDANGGNVEPFLYVLLIWLTRARPAWCGAIFALGFMQREFALYGFAALLAMTAFDRSLFTRAGLRRTAIMFSAAAATWFLVQFLKQYSSAAGPGTSVSDLYIARSNVSELASRICFDLGALPAGVWRLVTEHWPLLFGTSDFALGIFGIESAAHQGLPWSSPVLAATMLLAVFGIVRGSVRQWRKRRIAPHTALDATAPSTRFCVYLILVAAFSAAGYIAGRCGQLNYFVMRYEMLSILGAVGLGGWFLAVEPSRPLRRAWILLACATVAVSALGHARLWREYTTRPPTSAKQMIIRHLEAQGVRYASSDYWIAYYITFLTDERIIVSSEDLTRIAEHDRLVDAHRAESIRILRRPCEGGRQVIPGVYFCPG
jgi:hypothetical protein